MAEATTLVVQRAYAGNGDFIGWRLIGPNGSLQSGTLLLWNDQSSLTGFRVGNRFVPDIGEAITYRACDLVETDRVEIDDPEAALRAAGKE